MDHTLLSPPPRRPGRRHPRPAARALPDRRWTWLALGALLLLAPALLGAQGLRSAVASVSLVAVKPDPDSSHSAVRDMVVPLPERRADERVSVRLAQDGGSPLLVRTAGGRLERIGTTALATRAGPLSLRTVGASPGARWRLVVEFTAPDGQRREEHLEVAPGQR